MSDTITVRLKCFSHVRQALGGDEMEISLPVGATCEDVEEKVRALAGNDLDGITIRFAVNQKYQLEDCALADGDEVALIPPVQGG